jgi:TolB-like protein
MRVVRGLFLALMLSTAAQAEPRVAVLPFKDLSGEHPSVGEAIAETVTSDLRALPSVRVIERANVDRVLHELELTAHRADLDVPSTVKVGRLVSATLIVVGSYQNEGGQIRINARFVEVQTGELAGSAKVDGAVADFLQLQDRVTVELLKSARADGHLLAARHRPKLKSLRPVELYGDSVVEKEDAKKKELLTQVLKEEPQFEYAVHDLDAIERRLKQLDGRAQTAQADRFKEAQRQIAAEKDPDQRAAAISMMLSTLYMGRRFHQVIAEGRKILEHPGPPPTKANYQSDVEMASYWIVQCEYYLKDDDAVLRDGPKFLERFPASIFYSGVTSDVQWSIGRKKKIADGKVKAAQWMAQYGVSSGYGACDMASVYRGFNQYAEAQKLGRTCLSLNKKPRSEVLMGLVMDDIEIADWSAARADMDALEKENDPNVPGFATSYKMYIPSDG